MNKQSEGFSNELAQGDGKYLLIKSTCLRRGMWKLVSVADGSLDHGSPIMSIPIGQSSAEIRATLKFELPRLRWRQIGPMRVTGY
jgi:hypothetical protein